MKFINLQEFKELEKIHPYYSGRWPYFKEVINILKKEQFNSVLELGPGRERKTIVHDSDIMDFNFKSSPFIKYNWDATKIPWPIEDSKYDLFIALQVWEHLGNKQKEAFREVIRISKMAVLSFPLNWDTAGDIHHGITKEKISEWTLRIKPIKKIKVPALSKNTRLNRSRIIYFFKFDKNL